MNRMTITFDAKGDVGAICSDKPIELFFVSPSTPTAAPRCSPRVMPCLKLNALIS